jgi:lactoylglutathione lyase
MNKFFVPLLFIVLFSNSSTLLASENKNSTISQSKVMTKGLNHLGLTVKNLQASADFFINTLGWKKAGGYPDYPSIFVTDGEIFLTLWQTKDASKVISFDRKNNVGLHHLALTVASEEILTELHHRFISVPNLVIEFSPELNGKGPTIHMMIREPSGNRIEFAYNPPKGKN